MTTVDVLIVGGGPVGLGAAIEARLAGLSVVVCEPRPGPVDKACGEGLMPGAVQALERLGVRPGGYPFAGIRYLDPDRVAEHRFRAGPGLGVRRTVLQESLTARAAQLGVEVRRQRAGDIRWGLGWVAAGEGLRGRWLLACDGLHSRVRRQLGLQRPQKRQSTRPARYGLRRHYRIAPWSDVVEVHWTPLGEVYVTPVAADLVGVAVLGTRGTDYDAVLSLAPPLRDRLGGLRPASDLMGAGPLWQTTTRRTTGPVLLVGDAAGYIDALTGEGIRLGLAAARAAVAAIVAGRPADYERSWRRITRDYRLLTTALVRAAGNPLLRSRVVPLAARFPRLYGGIIDRLGS